MQINLTPQNPKQKVIELQIHFYALVFIAKRITKFWNLFGTRSKYIHVFCFGSGPITQMNIADIRALPLSSSRFYHLIYLFMPGELPLTLFFSWKKREWGGEGGGGRRVLTCNTNTILKLNNHLFLSTQVYKSNPRLQVYGFSFRLQIDNKCDGFLLLFQQFP